MDTAPAGLHKQPFHTRGQPATFVPYHAQLAAHHFLQIVLKDDRGVGVFFGPELSGKSCIVREFARNLRTEVPVAVVDATRQKTLDLLSAILDQFDPGPKFSSVNNCWYALRIFVTDHARAGQIPVVIIENLDKMYPSALYTLCKLAELESQDGYLLRIILTSSKAPFAIMHSPSMKAVASRSISAFELGPMTRKESSTYLQAKLRASGCDDPCELFPDEVIDDLHAESGGWPGKLDALALKAIENEEQRRTSRETSGAPQTQPAPEDHEQIQPVPEGHEQIQPASESPEQIQPAPEDPEQIQPAPEDHEQIQPASESPEQIQPASESPEQIQPASESPEQIQPAPESPEQIQPAPESPEQIQPEPDLPLLEAVVESVERPDIQRLFLTLNRKTLREIDLTESKILIGRSELCDVTIDSRFVSKHHALLVRTDDALYLLDLNSTNGTFVNSQRIQSKPLRHDDVISIGNHGIKLICPAYRTRPAVENLDLTETSTLRTLTHLRPSNEADDEETNSPEIGQR